MDLVLKDGIWILNINMIQSLALAVITYYLGVWVKTKVSVLDRLSMPSPVVGGMILAVILSVLQAAGVLIVHFDSTLQTLLMLAFFTTIGMMVSVKVVKQGGKLLVGFLVAVSVLAVLQNVLGMSLASFMGLDKHYGILTGAVSMMGGLGTSAAFGPYFEQTYGITGATAVAITSATFGMAAALILGGPFGEWLIRRYKVQTPQEVPQPEPPLHVPSDLQADIVASQAGSKPSFTDELMKAGGVVAVCMALGGIVSDFLGQFITLPAYIGSMIVAAVVRNAIDCTKSFRIDGVGLNAVADISLVLFVTMAVNSLKLAELINLDIPILVILLAQAVLVLVFSWFFIFLLFGKNYDTVMLSVGGVGFSMGSTANGLAVMQALSEKYGSNARAWLIVSLMGALLMDFITA